MTKSTSKVTLEDFEGLAKALGNAKALFKPFASRAMSECLVAISAEIEPYPPQPDRMRSGHLNTYVRGMGSYPKSAFIPDVEEPGGFSIKKGAKAIKLTSQQMDKKYRQGVKVTSDKVVGILSNEATYSGWVVGPEKGTPHQVSFHADTGWVNSDNAVKQAMPVITDAMDAAVEDFVEFLAM